jgi:hypothetical protein
MKKVLSVLLAAVMIVTLSSSAIYAAPNNNPNAAFNRDKSAFENKVRNNIKNEGEEKELKEQLRFTMLNGEGLPYGIGKRLTLPPGLQMLFERGTLPHGIAKKLMDNYYPLPGQKTDFEVLEALIVTANIKATAAVEADYKGGLTTINTFKAAIVATEKFVDEYVETQKAQVKTEIDKLKAAMKTFDDSKFAPEKLDEVKTILNKLMIFKANYYAVLTPEKQSDLDVLITFINTFTRTAEPVQLTKGDYDKIVMNSKAFSDPLVVLYNKITEAKVLLYKDITNTGLGYKVTEGTLPGNYLPGSNAALLNAITVAETFVATHTTQTLIEIKAEVETQTKKLDEAIKNFKGNKILSPAELSVVKMIINVLEDNNTKPYPVKMNTLINDLKYYVANPSLFTVTVYDNLLTRTKAYIPNLFDSLKAELEALIEDAEAKILLSTDADAIIALEALIVKVEAYIKANVLVYEELVAFFNEIVKGINEL